MKLIVVGAGNIGLVTALCFAERGHQVFCVDNDQTKINKLRAGENTLYEPRLDTLLADHLSKSNIQFSHQLDSFINQSDTIFVAVGTPNNSLGHVDLTAIEAVLNEISRLSITQTNSSLVSVKTIIIKSTVPPGTNNRLSEKYANFNFISSPEFLREGSAIYDCLNPDRIIVGSTGRQQSNAHPRAQADDDMKLIQKIYAEFNFKDEKFVAMDSITAELTKYAANIFLATRISLMNEFSRVCEKSGADIEKLKHGLGLDRRIGPEFLNAGIGYGGSCFPKDIDAFLSYASTLNESLLLTRAVKETNDQQIKTFAEKIIKHFKSVDTASTQTTLCLWGAAFKPETDDLREAPALKLIEYLLAQDINLDIKLNIKLNIYDPKSTLHLTNFFKDNESIKVFKNSYDALAGTDALIIATEWNEFKSANLEEIKKLLKKPVIFDGRNIFTPATMREMGFDYFSVGRA